MHQISHSSEIYGNHKAYLAFEVKTTVSSSRRRRGRRRFKGTKGVKTQTERERDSDKACAYLTLSLGLQSPHYAY